MEYELSRTKHEYEGLKSRNNWLEEELQSKVGDELQLRRELSAKINQLESSLVMSTSESTGLKGTVAHTQDQLSLRNEKLEEQAIRIRLV